MTITDEAKEHNKFVDGLYQYVKDCKRMGVPEKQIRYSITQLVNEALKS